MRRILLNRIVFVAYFLVSTGSIIWLASTCGFGCTTYHVERDSQTSLVGRDSTTSSVGRDSKSSPVGGDSKSSPVGGDSKSSPVGGDSKKIPTIYAITPTYTRSVQKADLTRVSQTFLHVRNFHWIVVEDSVKKTQLVTRFLNNSGLTYTHLNVKKTDKTTHSGIPQRNIALDWILENVTRDKEGVVYFADDDNTYDIRLFEEMRTIQKAGIWPVGLAGGIRFEGPIINDAGKVSSWHAMFAPNRDFPIDMAGFAVSVKYFREQSHVRFDPTSRPGWVETNLLFQLGLKKEDLEPRADNCTKVLAWHTQTKRPDLSSENRLIKLGKPSDPTIEV